MSALAPGTGTDAGALTLSPLPPAAVTVWTVTETLRKVYVA